MRNEFEKLIEAAKDYKEYQSIGNGAKLNCAIEAAELALQQSDVKRCLPTDYSRVVFHANRFVTDTQDIFIGALAAQSRRDLDLALKEINERT